jgi:hypothetical protein
MFLGVFGCVWGCFRCVLTVALALTGKTQHDAAQDYRRMLDQFLEVEANCSHFRNILTKRFAFSSILTKRFAFSSILTKRFAIFTLTARNLNFELI